MAIPAPYLNRPARSRLLSVPLWILAGALCLPTQVVGADAIKHFRLEGDKVVVEFENSPGQYFFLQQSLDYEHWEPADMSLGAASQTNVDLSAPRMFLRVIPYSLYAPLDSDGDGMDDVYELSHRDILNPLDPADGSKLTPGGSGLTNYQHYLKLFGIDTYKILQRETREVSLFNFGSPSATFEANTREQSVFNFGSPSAAFEANSREISIYNGEQVPYSDLLQIETREVSVFNFGGAAPGSNPAGPSATSEVVTREISVFNGEAVPPSDLLQIETREVSTFNFGSPSAPTEAISREVSVLNFTEP